MYLQIALFFLPLFMFAGVAAQAFGLYTLALLVPAVFFLRLKSSENRKQSLQESSHAFLRCGLSLAGLYLLFPVANLLNVGDPIGATIAGTLVPASFPLRRLGESLFSTAFLFSGLFLVLVSIGARKMKGIVSHSKPLPLLNSFFLGLGVFSLFWFLYLTFQSVTGFDYRVPGHLMKPEHRMSSGFYRVFGLYGHPLSVAAVALAIFAFSWRLFWVSLAERVFGGTSCFRRYFSFSVRKISIPAESLFLLIAVTQFFTIVASGGRTALAVAFLLCCLIPFSVRLNDKWRRVRRIFLVAAPCLFALLLFLNSRLFGFMSSLGQRFSEDRLTFWKVHWQMFCDKPWFGHGSFWISYVERLPYYNHMGYASLRDKYNAHNFYLETLASIGAVGALLIVFLVLVILRNLAVLVKSKPNAREVLIALLFAIVANLLHGFTQNVFFDANVTIVYLALTFVLLWSASLEVSEENLT